MFATSVKTSLKPLIVLSLSILPVVSSEQVRRKLESQVKRAWYTAPVWPLNVTHSTSSPLQQF
ncbi:hypothetical protein DPMN_000935 [Dreissena polymorpha]|uniref:Uncharacterized protein n=1 Tax=Dreissena polymorpha TaxID=45954 RepID=A0A9D4RQE3_DREPO|nr:hypothetical protein DPMN_000935 [Dreissena polymorpha]